MCLGLHLSLPHDENVRDHVIKSVYLLIADTVLVLSVYVVMMFMDYKFYV